MCLPFMIEAVCFGTRLSQDKLLALNWTQLPSDFSLLTVRLRNCRIQCADPELGQRALRDTINRMPDGTAILLAHQIR